MVLLPCWGVSCRGLCACSHPTVYRVHMVIHSTCLTTLCRALYPSVLHHTPHPRPPHKSTSHPSPFPLHLHPISSRGSSETSDTSRLHGCSVLRFGTFTRWYLLQNVKKHPVFHRCFWRISLWMCTFSPQPRNSCR